MIRTTVFRTVSAAIARACAGLSSPNEIPSTDTPSTPGCIAGISSSPTSGHPIYSYLHLPNAFDVSPPGGDDNPSASNEKVGEELEKCCEEIISESVQAEKWLGGEDLGRLRMKRRLMMSRMTRNRMRCDEGVNFSYF
jgi:hypothetical protein